MVVPKNLGFLADHATRVLKSTRLEDDVPSGASEKLKILDDRSLSENTCSLSPSMMETSMFTFLLLFLVLPF